MRNDIIYQYNDYYQSNKKGYYFALLFCLNFEEGGGGIFWNNFVYRNFRIRCLIRI